MQKKILTFIVKDRKLLALYSEPHPVHGDGGWFVVTGSIEGGEKREEAVKREIKEETNLEVKEVFDLNWGSVYKNWQGECQEFNLVSFVDKGQKIILDMKEVVDYEWLSLDEFVKKIKWNDDKELLKKVLEKGMNKKAYFDKKERGN